MTRTFGQMVSCPNCGHEHTVQSGFHRWIMGNDRLDSRKHGICVTDNDAIVHRYKEAYDKCGNTAGQRIINHLMHIEIKTNGSDTGFAQSDTLRILDSVLTRKRIDQQRDGLAKPSRRRTFLCINQRGMEVHVAVWGVFVLRLSGHSPESSQWIGWRSDVGNPGTDTKITLYDLECLLRFELNPITLKPYSSRRHHKKVNGRWQS